MPAYNNPTVNIGDTVEYPRDGRVITGKVVSKNKEWGTVRVQRSSGWHDNTNQWRAPRSPEVLAAAKAKTEAKKAEKAKKAAAEKARLEALDTPEVKAYKKIVAAEARRVAKNQRWCDDGLAETFKRLGITEPVVPDVEAEVTVTIKVTGPIKGGLTENDIKNALNQRLVNGYGALGESLGTNYNNKVKISHTVTSSSVVVKN